MLFNWQRIENYINSLDLGLKIKLSICLKTCNCDICTHARQAMIGEQVNQYRPAGGDCHL